MILIYIYKWFNLEHFKNGSGKPVIVLLYILLLKRIYYIYIYIIKNLIFYFVVEIFIVYNYLKIYNFWREQFDILSGIFDTFELSTIL